MKETLKKSVEESPELSFNLELLNQQLQAAEETRAHALDFLRQVAEYCDPQAQRDLPHEDDQGRPLTGFWMYVLKGGGSTSSPARTVRDRRVGYLRARTDDGDYVIKAVYVKTNYDDPYGPVYHFIPDDYAPTLLRAVALVGKMVLHGDEEMEFLGITDTYKYKGNKHI